MIPSSSSMACLDYTVEGDTLFEGEESFGGNLVGVVLSPGVVSENPDRITIQPRDTVINIRDDSNDGKKLYSKPPIDKIMSACLNFNMELFFSIQSNTMIPR